MQNISAAQLRRAADLKDRIESLTQELDGIFNHEIKRGFKMSLRARRAIGRAQKARWAKFHAK